MTSVGIIGGGIAGLTAAYTLKQGGVTPILFEARGRTGGVIKSDREDGFLIEKGPNALQSSTPLLRNLIEELGLLGDVQKASSQSSKRYIVLGNTPVAVPRSPLEVLSTPLLSPKAKIRLLVEPLIRKSSDENESVAEFVKRRLGKEVLDYGINPFVAGIFAGDPEELSLPHTFPKLHQLEQNYGSLIIGHIRSSLSRSAKKDGTNATNNGSQQAVRGLFTFKGGLQRLPDALAERVTDHIHLSSPVRAIQKNDSSWQIRYEGNGTEQEVEVDSLVYAAPLHALRHIKFQTTVDYDPLLNVSYPPVTLVAMGFRVQDVTHPLDGFGMLVPAIEKHLRILGTLFPSSIFPDCAPPDHHLLTTFIGGARHPELATMPDSELIRTVCQDLNRLLGLNGDPVYSTCIRWEKAIPQYAIGYGRIMKLLRTLEKKNPGLHFAGNYRQGISVGAACESGHAAGIRILRRINENEAVNTTPKGDA